MSNPNSSSPSLLNNPSLNDVNANMAPKSGLQQLPSACLGSPHHAGRKLTRSDSTFGEDIFDESLAELSQLNQRHLLRQQWYRKNNLVSRLRRSTSTASNSSSSSSSSSGISSTSGNIYSSGCSANTSSFASSFSSSFATLSSLSESCDTGEGSSGGSQGLSESENYPRILRKSSFKNKYHTCPYKPYYKPRRSSLQIFKAGPLELPENFKFYSPKAYLFGANGQQSGRFLVNNADGSDPGTLSFGTKSNPASPNKQNNFVSRGAGCMETMTERDDEVPSSMQAAQIVINTSGSTGCGGPSQQQQSGGSNQGQPVLLRSKSLDDLNTLLYYSNVYPSSPTPSDTSGGSQQPSGSSGQQAYGGAAPPHYASVNRIFSDYSKVDFNPSGGNCSTPPQLFSSLCFNSGPSSHQPTSQTLYPPDQALGMSNMKGGFSYSSHEICNAGAQPPPPGSQALSNTNNSSLCDIDHVLKKISSLRV